jgi:two-component system, OmpR family, alkaline phosphatase synthesis response regulator PhoP
MRSKPRILIVDDDEDILELLQYNFTKDDFLVTTLCESSKVLNIAKAFSPHLVILDLVMLPYNGIEVCKMIREIDSQWEPYIFFLTANASDYQQDVIYNIGGDELVEKIIGIKSLMNKVRCVLKQDLVIRKRETILKIGTLQLYRGTDEVYNKGEKIEVKKQEFEILYFLAQNPGKHISVSQLTDTLWGSKTFMDERAVKSLVHNLRRKIGGDIIAEKTVNKFLFSRAD